MDDIKKTVAQDVMVSPVVSVAPDEKLKNLEASFFHEQISGMPVVEDGNLIGFISKTDLVRLDAVKTSLDGYAREQLEWGNQDSSEDRELPKHFDLVRQLTVRDAMRDNIVTCGPLDPLPELAREMVRHQVHRIVVVDSGDPVGIVSTLDIADFVARLCS